MVTPVAPNTHGRRALKPLLLATGLARPLIEFRALLQLYRQALTDTGWRISAREQLPLDRNGRPLPLYTYAAIDFLRARLPEGIRVFEWGSGQSTLWYEQWAQTVISVEHDERWARHIRTKAGPNVTVLHRTSNRYVEALGEQAEPFDIIVVDGIKSLRLAGALLAPDHLTSAGIIIWDNLRSAEAEVARRDRFDELGFRMLPFSGIGPQLVYSGLTCIFYRPGNLLGL